MKKTLLTLAALTAAFGSVAVAADSFSVSTDTETHTNTGNGTYRGWVGSLTDGYLTTDTVLTDTITLTQISVAAATDSWSGTPTMKLAIYEYGGSLSQVTSSDAVALSTSTATWTQSGTLTFNFDNVELTKNTDYRFYFVSSSATVTDCSPWQNGRGASARLNVVNVGTTLTGSNCLVDGNTAASFSVNTAHAPNVTYTISNKETPAVPEPATATLSLLALAGLAARRRRK